MRITCSIRSARSFPSERDAIHHVSHRGQFVGAGDQSALGPWMIPKLRDFRSAR